MYFEIFPPKHAAVTSQKKKEGNYKTFEFWMVKLRLQKRILADPPEERLHACYKQQSLELSQRVRSYLFNLNNKCKC